MKILLLVCAFAWTLNNFEMDFTKEENQNWTVQLDGVMGGRSSGSLDYSKNGIVFTGKLSLENNGGFAAIRSPWGQFDFSETKRVKVRLKGDGRVYKLTLDDSKAWYLPNYEVKLKTEKDKWLNLSIPISDFRVAQMGQMGSKSPSSEQMKGIIRVGIILADKNPGPFELEVASIEFE